MRRALILVLASVASAKDPPPQCEGFGSCLMTGNIGAAVAHGVKEAAAELRKGDPLSKAVAGVIDAAKKETTSEKPNDGTCHKQKGKVCVKDEIVVETTFGTPFKFVKYTKNRKRTEFAECKNAHDETKKPKPGACRRATPGEIKIFEEDVAAFERWKKGGMNGEEPEMRRVAKFADEGSADVEKEIEEAKDEMVDILDFVAYSPEGGKGGFKRQDPVSVMVRLDQCVSKAIPGRGRKFTVEDLQGASPAKRKQLREAQVALLEEYEKKVPAKLKEKDKMMSGNERFRRARVKQKEEDEKREKKRKNSNQVTLTEWSSKEGEPVKRKSGEIKRVTPGNFLESTVLGKEERWKVTKSCLMKAFGGEEGVKKKAPKLLKPIFG